MHKQWTTVAHFRWSSSVASYALGPLDESSLIESVTRSKCGENVRVWVPDPAHLPPALVEAEAFSEALSAGLMWEDWGETPASVANWVCGGFTWDLSHGGSYEWIVGWILGSLAVLAQEDWQLARVGMAHLCFLVSLVPSRSHIGFHAALREARGVHGAVVKAYRSRVRALKEQGVGISQAWRLALSSSNGKL